MSQQEAKKVVGRRAAELVEDGMHLGLGTGSTTACALEAIGERIRAEGLDVVGVPTSPAAERLSRTCGIPLTTLDDLAARGDLVLDLALDGADEVTPGLDLVKGRGAAMTRERVVAACAHRFVALIDPRKLVDRLGTRMPLPVEVLPMAVEPAMRAVEALGGRPELRLGQAKDGPVVTDQGFWVVDVYFEAGIANPTALSAALYAIPGVLDHGLFLQMATDALVGRPDGTVEHRAARPR